MTKPTSPAFSRRQALKASASVVGGAVFTHAMAASASPQSTSTHAAGGSVPTQHPSAAAGTPSVLTDYISVSDFESPAQAKLSAMAWALVTGGAADELTIRWNREAFDRVRLQPKVLVDVSSIDTTVELFGSKLPHPILLAPTAYHRMIHAGGEVETARGASRSEACLVVSSASNTRVDEIRKATQGPMWFQLYLQSDRGFTREVLSEVERGGCSALVLTVDAPVVGPRYRQIRAKFKLTPGLELPYMYDINRGRDSLLRGGNLGMTWKDVEWLRGESRLPLILKGILNPEDARLAVRHGAQGLIVSNHGGRMLDTAPATLDALPRVMEKVGGRVPVMMDGGVRRGTDVLKALAMGAKAVLIGRPYLHGLAVAGGDGVARVVEVLRDELQQAMALTGRTRLGAVDRSVLW